MARHPQRENDRHPVYRLAVPAAAGGAYRELVHHLQRWITRDAGRVRQDLACLPDEKMKLPSSMRVFERGWLSSNNILFIGRDGTALVDSGYVTHAQQTVALVTHALQGRRL